MSAVPGPYGTATWSDDSDDLEITYTAADFGVDGDENLANAAPTTQHWTSRRRGSISLRRLQDSATGASNDVPPTQ